MQSHLSLTNQGAFVDAQQDSLVANAGNIWYATHAAIIRY